MRVLKVCIRERLLKASILTQVNIASVLYIAYGKRGWSALADHSVML